MPCVHYQLQVADLSTHTLAMTLTFTPQNPLHELSLPSWIPGSYMIRNFARHILHIRAYDHTGELPLQQRDKQRWELRCRDSAVTVEYHIYANDLSVRAAYVDDEVAILNPACLCLAVSGLTECSQQFYFAKPRQRVTENWRVGTALPRLTAEHATENTEKRSVERVEKQTDTGIIENLTPTDIASLTQFGTFEAKNYAHLIDSPIVAGIFSLQHFTLDDVPHYVLVTGNTVFDEQRLVNDVATLCQAQRDVFGSLPDDLNQYWFLLWVTEQGYGGLEHEFSTLLLCNRSDLPIAHLPKQADAYQNLLGLFSHEYFHTWWVKRLKPACFIPYQLEKEQYSRQLWMYEGFTSYFDDLALVKSGLIDEKQYLTSLEKLISRVTRNPSERMQSLSDSSFTAWTKFYLQDENAVNSVVSYYAKGALVALLLEAELQQQGRSLAELCRVLYQQYRYSGTTESSIFTVLQGWQLSHLADQLKQWVDCAQPLPLANSLAYLGLDLQWRSPNSMDDLSGRFDGIPSAHLGCSVITKPNGVFVHQVYQHSAAQQASLMSGDQLLAVAGVKITEQSLPELLRRLPLNTEQSLVIFRKDRLLTLSLPLREAAKTVAMLTISEPEKLNNWLKG